MIHKITPHKTLFGTRSTYKSIRRILNLYFLLFFTSKSILAIPVFTSPNPVTLTRFDPAVSASVQEKFTYILVYETVIGLNSKNKLQGMIAKNWQIDRAKNKVTIYIHPDHKFSDGSEVTSRDILNSFSEFCEPSSIGVRLLNDIEGCGQSSVNTGIKIVDPLAIEFQLKGDPTQFLHKLTNVQIPVFKRTKGEILGSGKYYIKEISQEEVTFSKNQWFHVKDDSIPEFSILHIEEAEIASSLESEKWAGSMSYLQNTFNNFHSDKYLVNKDRKLITQTIFFNNQRYPFNNRLLRKSILNQIEISQESGKIDTLNEVVRGFIPRGLGGSISGIKRTAPREKSIFKLPKPVNVTLHQHLGRKNTELAAELSRIFLLHNINLEFKWHESYKDLWPRYFDHSLDLFIELVNFKHKESFPLLSIFVDGNSENLANISDSTLTKLILDSKQVKSRSFRYKLYQKSMLHLEEMAYIVPLYYTGSATIYHRCFESSAAKNDFNPFSFIQDARLKNTLECRKKFS